MQNSKSTSLQDSFTNTFRDVANSSLEIYKPLMKNVIDSMTSINQSVLAGDYTSLKLPTLFKETCQCCPPDCECPTNCMAAIERYAMKGERILVPFGVKNSCSHIKTYRLGVRELKDQDGKMAVDQPRLNKHSITLEPGQSIRVLMLLDLENVVDGSTYATEIVLREKDINQNICFTLRITDECKNIMVEPQDEKKMQMRWQSWQDHYWCEPKKARLVQSPPAETVSVPVTEIDGSLNIKKL